MKKKPDVNDTLRAEGEDGVRARHDRATRYKYGQVKPPRFKLTPFGEVTVGSERVYLVKGIIPRRGLILVWGPPKCGKSFWTFDLVMHVALGWSYRGRRVQQGPVVYLALEGSEGFKARVQAFRQQHLADHEQEAVPFYLVIASIDLIKDHRDLIESIGAQIGKTNPVLVAIDTLNRSLAGSESSDEDMASYVKAAGAIEAAFECAVTIVHHCGVDGTRPRGHTSLTGAADAQHAVRRDAADNVSVTIEYMKDGAEGDQIISRLETVEVRKDIDGDAITSCVIVPVEMAMAEAKPAATKPAKAVRMPRPAVIALRALTEAINECGEAAPTSNYIPRAIYVTTFDRWRDYAYRRGISDGEKRAQQKAFKQASEYLIAGEYVSVWEGYVWTKTVTPKTVPETEQPIEGKPSELAN